MTGEARDFHSPAYKRWRRQVYGRDHFRCRLCGSREGLNAHHIRTWSRYPGLRFVVSNGITLCSAHHSLVKDREEEFVKVLEQLVHPPNDAVRLALIRMRYEEE